MWLETKSSNAAGTSMKCHVNVRLKNDDPKAQWRHEWRQVEVEQVQGMAALNAAIEAAEKMPDVAICLEASFIPGGAVT